MPAELGLRANNVAGTDAWLHAIAEAGIRPQAAAYPRQHPGARSGEETARLRRRSQLPASDEVVLSRSLRGATGGRFALIEKISTTLIGRSA